MRGIVTVPIAESFLFPLSKTYVQRGGFNSEILHIHFVDGRKKVVKSIGSKRGGFSLQRAEELASDILLYQERLEAVGVPMPPTEKIVLEYSVPEKQAFILTTSEWTGLDMEIIIGTLLHSYEMKDQILMRLVGEMTRIIASVCSRRISTWETEVGIDPKPSNFTLDENGKVWYVDPFPPRYRKNGEAIIEWIKPQTVLGQSLGYFKYFDVRGILLGFTAQLSRIRPTLKMTIEEFILGEFENVMQKKDYAEFRNALNHTPWRMIRESLTTPFDARKQTSARTIIEECLREEIFGVDYSIYTLREIALELACKGIMSLMDMESFFKESHFEDEMPQEKLVRLQETLYRFLP